MSDGYLFVPLPDRVNRRRPATVLDRRLPSALSGTLSIELLCEQPVHIGSGFKQMIGPRVVRSAVRIKEGLGLPGSSVKGMLRSRYEAITYSCTEAPKGNVWEIRSSTGLTKARIKHGSLDLPALRVCSSRESEMCPACALFGRMSQRSRISVTDFYSSVPGTFALFELPEQFGPNIHHVGKATIIADERSRDRGPSQMFEVSELKGRKFALGQGRRTENPKLQPVEVIPAGTVLVGQIRFMNALPAEMGGLLAAMGRKPMSKLKIGAGKCYGLGRMSLRSLSISLRSTDSSDPTDIEQSWRTAFESVSSDRFVEGEETLVRIHQGAC